MIMNILLKTPPEDQVRIIKNPKIRNLKNQYTNPMIFNLILTKAMIRKERISSVHVNSENNSRKITIQKPANQLVQSQRIPKERWLRKEKRKRLTNPKIKRGRHFLPLKEFRNNRKRAAKRRRREAKNLVWTLYKKKRTELWSPLKLVRSIIEGLKHLKRLEQGRRKQRSKDHLRRPVLKRRKGAIKSTKSLRVIDFPLSKRESKRERNSRNRIKNLLGIKSGSFRCR